jgi:aspartyl aminopeptidase
MSEDQLNQQLTGFINAAPTPYHAVHELVKRLEQAQFKPLHESDSWNLHDKGRYYVVRNGSSLIAFTYHAASVSEQGIRMIGAHTDSPCLKVKPNPVITQNGYLQLGVEVYGGVLMNPWFDRDLSLAGRLSYRAPGGKIRNGLINFERPIATIPSLAIHLDREANSSRTVNSQKDLPPLLMKNAGKLPFAQLLLQQAQLQLPDVEEILSYELSFYDTHPASIIGLDREFIAGARLDNLLSCYAGLHSLLAASGKTSCLLVCNDHEEVGSTSAAGAHGPFLKSTLQRICGSADEFHKCLSRSMLLSVDNAHGVHPNYPDKHDNNHGPLLNEGPVIKINSNQRYASNSETVAFFKNLCNQDLIPNQFFVTRNDMACGSTIGPITAAELGLRTLDIGIPTFGMHSIRELCGSKDPEYLIRACTAFYNFEGDLGSSFP